MAILTQQKVNIMLPAIQCLIKSTKTEEARPALPVYHEVSRFHFMCQIPYKNALFITRQ